MIIMLAGPRKSGKTKIAEDMGSSNYDFMVVSFADIIKEAYSQMYSVPIADLYDPVTKEKYRQGLDFLGKEARKEQGKYFLPNTLFDRIKDIECDNIVIDDLRTIEELEVGLNHGAVPYFVYSDIHVRTWRGFQYNREIDESYLERELQLTQETYNALGGGYIYNNYNDIPKRLRETVMFTNDLMEKSLCLST
jgi:phosphomevalonate kinase